MKHNHANITSTLPTMAAIVLPTAALLRVNRRFRPTVSIAMLSVEAGVAWFGLQCSLYCISSYKPSYICTIVDSTRPQLASMAAAMAIIRYSRSA